jgi:hypothetical protein
VPWDKSPLINAKSETWEHLCAHGSVASTHPTAASYPPPPPSEDGTGRDKPSVISCILVRDDSRTEKNSNTHARLYWQQFYDAPRTTAKNYFAPLTISIPAASTMLNLWVLFPL